MSLRQARRPARLQVSPILIVLLVAALVIIPPTIGGYLPRALTSYLIFGLLALAAGCRHIITHNVKDFHGSEQLGVTAITPRDFLNLIRARR